MECTNKNLALAVDSLVALYDPFQFTQLVINTFFSVNRLPFVCRVFCGDVHFTLYTKSACLFDKSDIIYLLHVRPSSAILGCIVADELRFDVVGCV